MNLEADNLVSKTTDQGIVLMPQYVEYLLSQGFIIESVDETRVVQSQTDREKGYLVLQITTYERPRNHPELDYEADKMQLDVCSCWSYRQNSTDVVENKTPSGSCKHTTHAFRTKKAQEDDSQTSLSF